MGYFKHVSSGLHLLTLDPKKSKKMEIMPFSLVWSLFSLAVAVIVEQTMNASSCYHASAFAYPITTQQHNPSDHESRGGCVSTQRGVRVPTVFALTKSSSSADDRSGTSDGATPSTTTTIAVCTGPDCRVDGSTDCIRQLQKQVSTLNNSSDSQGRIKVTGRACVGPCGDGPCAFVLDGEGQKIIQQQPSKKQVALVPPDIFGSDPKGWYQIKTSEQLQEVVSIASKAKDKNEESLSSSLLRFQDIQSCRPPWDRPRNERKVCQRIMQVSVLWGLEEFSNEDVVGSLQLSIAFALWGLSELIMKENIFSVFASLFKKRK